MDRWTDEQMNRAEFLGSSSRAKGNKENMKKNKTITLNN